ncbi:unnamed protein product [Boreogadus saida]
MCSHEAELLLREIFFFEVQVKDKTAWWLGVARESIHRKGETKWTPGTGYWTLDYDKDGLVFNDAPDVDLPLRAELQKVGVFVDYDEGLVSFYDVEARVHIYSATGCTFTEPLYPILCPHLHYEDGADRGLGSSGGVERSDHSSPRISSSCRTRLTTCSTADFDALYEELQQLGQGGFGSVFAGCRKEDRLPVAIKHIPMATVSMTQENQSTVLVLLIWNFICSELF